MAYPKHVGVSVFIVRAEIVIEFINVLVLIVAFVGHSRGREVCCGSLALCVDSRSQPHTRLIICSLRSDHSIIRVLYESLYTVVLSAPIPLPKLVIIIRVPLMAVVASECCVGRCRSSASAPVVLIVLN